MTQPGDGLPHGTPVDPSEQGPPAYPGQPPAAPPPASVPPYGAPVDGGPPVAQPPPYGAPAQPQQYGAPPQYGGGAPQQYGAQPYGGAPQPYGAPQYAAQPFGGPMGAKTSGLAVAALILSIVWLCGLGSIVGIILGIVARSQISKSNGTMKGKGLATAAIIVGAVTLILTILFWVIAGSLHHCSNGTYSNHC